MEQERYPGLHVSEDMRRQKREWVVQRVAWVILYGLLIAVALGVAGSGILSRTLMESPESALQMKYDRFMRWRSPNDLFLTVQSSSNMVRIVFDSQYVRQVEIERIIPSPQQMISAGDTTIFVFNASPPGPMQAEFQIRPDTVGKLNGWVAVEGKPRHHFSQFVFP